MHNSASLVQVNHTQPLLNISADAKVFISTVTQISNETNLTHQQIEFFRLSLYSSRAEILAVSERVKEHENRNLMFNDTDHI